MSPQLQVFIKTDRFQDAESSSMKFINLCLLHLGKINRCTVKIGVTSFTMPAAMQSVEHRRCYMMMNKLLKFCFFRLLSSMLKKYASVSVQFGIIIAENVKNLSTIQ